MVPSTPKVVNYTWPDYPSYEAAASSAHPPLSQRPETSNSDLLDDLPPMDFTSATARVPRMYPVTGLRQNLLHQRHDDFVNAVGKNARTV